MQARSWKYRPNTIQIEAVQGCNRRCSFCGTAGMEKAIRKADIKTIYHTCELIKAAELNSRILLAGHGEPTLHPEIVQIVKAIRTMLPHNMIHMFTNGTVIAKKPELTEELFKAGLNDLIFDEYTDSRVGKFVRADPICRKYEIVELKPGVPLFADKKTTQHRICITPPINIDEKNATRKIINHCGAGRPPLKTPLEKKCGTIFRDFFIRWDGNIAICCNDFRGEYPVTNILKHKSFEDAYFHPRLEAARRILMQADRSFAPCSKCDALPLRVGLLPDPRGPKYLPEPTEADRKLVREKHRPLAKIELRPWEE